MSTNDVKQLAQRLEETWTCPSEDLDAMHWALESHQIAIEHVYALKEYSKSSETYAMNAQKVCERKLVYAGCRLAALLNHLRNR